MSQYHVQFAATALTCTAHGTKYVESQYNHK